MGKIISIEKHIGIKEMLKKNCITRKYPERHISNPQTWQKERVTLIPWTEEEIEKLARNHKIYYNSSKNT